MVSYVSLLKQQCSITFMIAQSVILYLCILSCKFLFSFSITAVVPKLCLKPTPNSPAVV